MDVTATTSVSAGTNAAAANAITGDFETFLTLLTAQLKNQDPLNPTDNTEFVAQLASFSAVEQQVQTNDLLQRLVDAGGGDLAAQSAWLGQAVRTDGPTAYAGDPLELRFDPQSGATAQVVAIDRDGNVVDRIVVDPSSGRSTWPGAGSPPILRDTYTFELRTPGGAVVPATPVSVVEEVRITDSRVQLLLADGRAVAPADVIGALRDAP